MEGLIPMVYKALKRNKERSHYEFLSSTTAQAYNVSDFNPSASQTQSRSHFYFTMPPNGTVDKRTFEGRGVRHSRSFSSTAEFSFRKRFDPEDNGSVPMQRKLQLVRFRSTRMLSCLTGA